MGHTLMNSLTWEAMVRAAHDSNPTLVQPAEAREAVKPVEIHRVPRGTRWIGVVPDQICVTASSAPSRSFCTSST